MYSKIDKLMDDIAKDPEAVDGWGAFAMVQEQVSKWAKGERRVLAILKEGLSMVRKKYAVDANIAGMIGGADNPHQENCVKKMEAVRMAEEYLQVAN